MKSSTLAKLDDIQVSKLLFEIDPACDHSSLVADDLDFDVLPFSNKEDKVNKKIAFSLKTNRKDLGLSFEIVVFYEYSFFAEKSEEDEVKIGVTAIVPQILAFIRGILFIMSSCSPRRVLLPMINVIDSFIEQQGESHDNEEKTKLAKELKSENSSND